MFEWIGLATLALFNVRDILPEPGQARKRFILGARQPEGSMPSSFCCVVLQFQTQKRHFLIELAIGLDLLPEKELSPKV